MNPARIFVAALAVKGAADASGAMGVAEGVAREGAMMAETFVVDDVSVGQVNKTDEVEKKLASVVSVVVAVVADGDGDVKTVREVTATSGDAAAAAEDAAAEGVCASGSVPVAAAAGEAEDGA